LLVRAAGMAISGLTLARTKITSATEMIRNKSSISRVASRANFLFP
jgi:hypothetical protein